MTTVLGPRRSHSTPLENKSVPPDRPHPEDAAVLLPTNLPPSIESKAGAIWRVGLMGFFWVCLCSRMWTQRILTEDAERRMLLIAAAWQICLSRGLRLSEP